MPCQSPLRQYHTLSGSGWTFNAQKPHDEYRDLDCGVCIECRIRKTRDWAIRCYHESQLHSRSCWVTLTYEHNPITLVRRDVQLFFKSLRNAGRKFRYFGCGEYGPKTLRPHYHIILFGTDFPDQIPWRKNGENRFYRSPTLEKHWQHGHAEIGDVTAATATYTAGYITKKINGRMAEEADPETGLRPYDRVTADGQLHEVSREQLYVSLKPGLAFDWLKDNWQEIYPRDRVVFKGKEYVPPKYYDRMLELYHPTLWEEVLNARLEYLQQNEKLTDERRNAINAARQSFRKHKEHPRDKI